jgi:endoglucanase
MMGVGWNLGNALDSHRSSNAGTVGYDLPNPDIARLEGLWLGGSTNITNRNLITAVRAAGFDTIRIPVTWYKVADPNNNFKIHDGWMARVRQLVDWAVEEDFYIILNTHHEYPIYNEYSRWESESAMTRAQTMLTAFWTQIATEFKDYNEKLIFEGLNEPRCMDDRQWYGYGNDTAQGAELYRRLNVLNQDFVNAVRATGGNNAHRILMIPTYAASGHFWNSRGPFDNFQRPNDPANPSGNRESNKLVLSVHRYEPVEFTLEATTTSWDQTRVQDALRGIASRARRPNIDMPVILGEWGTTNNSNTAERARYSEFYVGEATSQGMRTVLWDNGSNGTGRENLGIFNRQTGAINSGYQAIIDAILLGRWGDSRSS